MLQIGTTDRIVDVKYEYLRILRVLHVLITARTQRGFQYHLALQLGDTGNVEHFLFLFSPIPFFLPNSYAFLTIQTYS